MKSYVENLAGRKSYLHLLFTNIQIDFNSNDDSNLWPDNLLLFKLDEDFKMKDEEKANSGRFHQPYPLLQYNNIPRYVTDENANIKNKIPLILKARGGLLSLRANLNFQGKENLSAFILDVPRTQHKIISFH